MIDLPPGRELDEFVAKKVMRLETYASPPESCPQCGVQVPDGYFHFVHRLQKWTCLSGHRLIETPSYSTDIAAAWEVAEKAQLFTRQMLILAHDGEGWILCDEVSPAGPQGVVAKASTAPHAICLASISTLNIDILSQP